MIKCCGECGRPLPRMQYERKCSWCKDVFIPTHGRMIYCSLECQFEARRASQTAWREAHKEAVNRRRRKVA